MAELPAYLGEVPNYEVVRGQMHISIDAFQLVMPLHVFLQGCERGKRAIKRWQSQPRPDAKIFDISALR